MKFKSQLNGKKKKSDLLPGGSMVERNEKCGINNNLSLISLKETVKAEGCARRSLPCKPSEPSRILGLPGREPLAVE